MGFDTWADKVFDTYLDNKKGNEKLVWDLNLKENSRTFNIWSNLAILLGDVETI